LLAEDAGDPSDEAWQPDQNHSPLWNRSLLQTVEQESSHNVALLSGEAPLPSLAPS
jgi:hypothetical protein